MSNKDLHNNIKNALFLEDKKLKEIAPSLWWAIHYHKNSHMEDMDFIDVPYLVALYTAILNNPLMVVEKSVQCGLSELFIVHSHVEAQSGLTVFYVLPKYEMRNRFVNNRVSQLHIKVPKYREMIKASGKGYHRTSLMQFGKGTLVYVGSNVETEFLEIPIDSAYVDEKDRCHLSNLDLLPDRYTASAYKYHREISNPTIENFGIDERYQISTQGQWHITCIHCGRQFIPDFFRHVVRQTGPREYEALDNTYDPDSKGEIALICECGKPVDRLMEGEYVPEFPGREWEGYRISKLFNKFASMRSLVDRWIDIQGNDTKIQKFYNSDLGLPYTAEGSKITDKMLNACKRDYALTTPEIAQPIRFIGVDVGADLHYVIRDLVKERGVRIRRLVAVGVVPTFKLLYSEVIDKWKPRVGVVDAFPEIHKVMELKAKYKYFYSSKFQFDQRKMSINKNDREISMDRTALLDYMKQSFDQHTVILPVNAEHLENGQYYSHLKASTRILQTDDENPEKSRFEWVNTTANHWFFAEAYCYQAYVMLPNIDDVIDFFTDNTQFESMTGVGHIKNLTEVEKKELSRKSALTPSIVLNRIRTSNIKKKT